MKQKKDFSGFWLFVIIIGSLLVVFGIPVMVGLKSGFFAMLFTTFIEIFIIYLLFGGSNTNQSNQSKEKINYTSECPNCGSFDTRKLTNSGRALSILALGLASSSIGKQYVCNHCGHKW